MSHTFEETTRAELLRSYRAVLKAERKTREKYSRSEYLEDILTGKQPILKVPETLNNNNQNGVKAT
jgi:hypothetical protein